VLITGTYVELIQVEICGVDTAVGSFSTNVRSLVLKSGGEEKLM